MSTDHELKRLRDENASLKALLTLHGIDWSGEPAGTPSNGLSEPRVGIGSATEVRGNNVPVLSTEAKVALFRGLFHGRQDVFARRWESARGKSGYTPACAHEWSDGICEKPRIKCPDCPHRQFLPLTDRVLFDHLSGTYVVGIYPLLDGDMCRFLAVDFDRNEWKDDASAFAGTCRSFGIPCAVEISRSGDGAHVWIFFQSSIPATEARRLGAVMITQTCSGRRQLELSSYDRLFPNQDRVPAGGLGNLIALPLQKKAREQSGSVFVDEDFHPYADQWTYLASLERMTSTAVHEAIDRCAPGGDALDLAYLYEGDEDPWKKKPPQLGMLPGPLPERIAVVLADRVYIKKDSLPQPILNRIIRLAAFPNPAFFRAQAMRMPVWNIPRVIGSAENFQRHIALPRGCREDLATLLSSNGIVEDAQDERSTGQSIEASFTGTLRPEQSVALDALLRHEIGVLKAPTAFGKTIVAASVIARRGVSTLILVHRSELLNQWKEKLEQFLSLECDGVLHPGSPATRKTGRPPDGMTGGIGVFGGGKKRPKGLVDIAVMQSLSRREDLPGFLSTYGQIIVDECHHVSALSFETILKQAPCRFVLGLTATPIRRDGLDPIIFMQCGPIRHSVDSALYRHDIMEVKARFIQGSPIPVDAGIQAALGSLVVDENRNSVIVQDIEEAWREGRKVIVLTERSDHLDGLAMMLGRSIPTVFILHGRMKRKERAAVLAGLEALSDAEPRIILATGKLIGEGFDHPSLDTLILAMPISWRGTLSQYAGRLNRVCAGKDTLRIYDYIDSQDPRLSRMWNKRERGYRALGYTIVRTEHRNHIDPGTPAHARISLPLLPGS